MRVSKAPKTIFVCNECGAQFPKWAGQCGDCGAWNTLQETVDAPAPKADGRFAGYAGDQPAGIVNLAEVAAEDTRRIATGLAELDRVLGGGIVPGSVILLGGDPGIGKSTLLMQLTAALSARFPGLYITGEESLEQLGMRARRLRHCATANCGPSIWTIRPHNRCVRPGFGRS